MSAWDHRSGNPAIILTAVTYILAMAVWSQCDPIYENWDSMKNSYHLHIQSNNQGLQDTIDVTHYMFYLLQAKNVSQGIEKYGQDLHGKNAVEMLNNCSTHMDKITGTSRVLHTWAYCNLDPGKPNCIVHKHDVFQEISATAERLITDGFLKVIEVVGDPEKYTELDSELTPSSFWTSPFSHADTRRTLIYCREANTQRMMVESINYRTNKFWQSICVSSILSFSWVVLFILWFYNETFFEKMVWFVPRLIIKIISWVCYRIFRMFVNWVYIVIFFITVFICVCYKFGWTPHLIQKKVENFNQQVESLIVLRDALQMTINFVPSTLRAFGIGGV
jgi:hypothetical protein